MTMDTTTNTISITNIKRIPTTRNTSTIIKNINITTTMIKRNEAATSRPHFFSNLMFYAKH